MTRGGKEPKRPWNTSTRLDARQQETTKETKQQRSPRRRVKSHEETSDETPQPTQPPSTEVRETTRPVQPARDMIESAMSIALEDVLGDTAVLDESIDVAELSPLPPPPPPPPPPSQHPDRTSALLQQLSISETRTDALRVRYQERRRRREQEQVEEASKSKQSAAFYRRITTARLEFEQRKLAIESLRARIDREMQFLLATAQELEAREELLEDAFRGYEQLLRAEYGLERDAHAG